MAFIKYENFLAICETIGLRRTWRYIFSSWVSKPRPDTL